MTLLRMRGAKLTAILLLTFLLFAPALNFSLVYDDYSQLVYNPRLRSWSAVPGYFTTHLWAHWMNVAKYYRPLFLLWYRLVYVVLGPPGSVWHLSSILAHLAAVACVFLLVYRLTQSSQGASLASLLFAIHPVQTEAVAWVSAAGEPLVTMFLALTVYFYVTRRRRISPPSLLFATLAMFTKETGVLAPFLILAYEWAHRRYKEGVVAAAPYLLPEALYMAVRWRAMRGFVHTTAAHPMSFSTMLLNWPHALALYALHLAWPLGLSPFYDFPIRTALWPMALLIVVIAAVGWKLHAASPTLRFGAAWAAMTLAPALAFRYIFQQDCIHDHYLYLPFVGIALMLAPLLGKIRLNRVAGALVCLCVLLLCWQTHRTLQYWRNDEAMFGRGVQVAPNNPVPNNGLGYVYLWQKRPAQALPLLLQAVRVDPGFKEAYPNLVRCYLQLGDQAAAMHYFAIEQRLPNP